MPHEVYGNPNASRDCDLVRDQVKFPIIKEAEQSVEKSLQETLKSTSKDEAVEIKELWLNNEAEEIDDDKWYDALDSVEEETSKCHVRGI